ASKLRAHVEEFCEIGLYPHLVLDVGAYDGRSVFRAQSQAVAVDVRPSVHLLRDYIGLFADSARKEFRVLEDRCANLAKSVAAEGFAGYRFDMLKFVRLSRTVLSEFAWKNVARIFCSLDQLLTHS